VVTEAPRAAASTRRTLLRTSGTGLAAGAVVVLAGCGKKGRTDLHKLPPTALVADIEMLNRALDLEHKAIAAYTAGIPLLSRHDHAAAKRFLGQELSHAGELAGLINQAGGEPDKPRQSYNLGRPRDRTDVLRLLHELERAQIEGYVQAISVVSPGPVRAAVAAILANDAQHVAVLRSSLGLNPLSGAFVAGGE
jgi:bacterioferritin (cytochrome b1)